MRVERYGDGTRVVDVVTDEQSAALRPSWGGIDVDEGLRGHFSERYPLQESLAACADGQGGRGRGPVGGRDRRGPRRSNSVMADECVDAGDVLLMWLTGSVSQDIKEEVVVQGSDRS